MPATEPESPGVLIRSQLQERGWTQQDLAAVTGLSRQTIYQLMHDRSGVTPDVAVALGAAFNMSALDWLRLDGERRLASSTVESNEIARRRSILEFAPVREMQGRGWIPPSETIEELESELKSFYRVGDLSEGAGAGASFRMNRSAGPDARAVRAWLMRAIHLAELVSAAPFQPERMEQLYRDLRLVAALSKETHRVPGLLGKYGIRFVVVEHLKNTRVDGAAFWLDDRSPAVAMSVRYDRIDAFWFTLMHELKHIEHGDGLSVDDNLAGSQSDAQEPDADPREARANDGAAAALIDPAELESFINRVSPLYSSDRIVQFAQRVKIHPGIVVGQLQHRSELGFEAMRKYLVKVREIAIESALTDGWGKSVPALTVGR